MTMRRRSDRWLGCAAALGSAAAILVLAAPAHAGTASIVMAPINGLPQFQFIGGAEANRLSVVFDAGSTSQDPLTYRVSDQVPISVGPGCSNSGSGMQATCVIQGRSQAQGRADLGSGDDQGVSTGTISVLLFGGAGDDTLNGQFLDGGPGGDTLNGFSFSTSLNGGPGNDTVNGGTGSDIIMVAVGDGADTISGGSSFDALTPLAPGLLDPRGDTISQVEMLIGTAGDDTILADDRGWLINGQAGADRLTGGMGVDTIEGVAGDDTIDGGPGADGIAGGAGDDTVDGGSGADSIDGGDGGDRLVGGTDQDFLSGGPGGDRLRTNDGFPDTVNCGSGNDRTTADGLDTLDADCEFPDRDGDALPDLWETNGYDADGDGTPDVDLPGMGADPDRKDIFLEIDFMAPHRLEQSGVDLVVQAFAAAPVPNPNGPSGIELHVDNGPGSVMDPSSGALWGARSGHDQVPHQAVLGSVTPGAYQWGEFDLLKLAHFADEREPVFHYAISAHAHSGTVSGIARGAPSSDLLVTLGEGCLQLQGVDCTLAAKEQAGTLMHELGHNLGLLHGGDDSVSYKPSYLSVMNYAFQLTGLVGADLSTRLDFARFGISMDEAALDEAHGFGMAAGSDPARFLTVGYCPNGSQVIWPLLDGALDFDCDGTITQPGTVASDTNKDSNTTAFGPFVDWPALIFDGGAIGASGRSIPAETELIEPDMAELLSSQRAIEAYIASKQPGTPPPAGPSPLDPVRLTGLRVKPGRFRSARRGRSIVKRGGTKVTYRLNRAASVVFTVQRRKGRRWTRVRGSFKHAGKKGANVLRFSGRIAGKRLRPGRHRLVATPAGGTAARAPFAVRR